MNQPELLKPGTQEVMQLYDGSLIKNERVLYPDSHEAATAAEVTLLEDLAKHKLEGGHIALVDGAFDVPHSNHTWYLMEVRRRAAQRYFRESYETADQLTRQAMAASDEIKLVVTLDADEKIARKKGFKADKGNVERPIYPWSERSSRIGGFMIPDGTGRYRPVIDLVTVEGDRSHEGTMFTSHLSFGEKMAATSTLDTWVLFSEHEATVEVAKSYASEGVIDIIKKEEAVFVVDPRTGRGFSSSALIRKIKGE